MKAFRILLIFIFIAIVGYTIVTVSQHGLNLLPIFFGDIAKMGWQGQFNFDFLGFLILSGLWTAWREKFSPKGILLGIFAFFGGVLFLSAYLFYLSIKTESDIAKIMLGERVV